MQAFKNEFGDVIWWRVALACAAGAAASVGLAVALFGRAPEARTTTETDETVAYEYRPDPGDARPEEPSQDPTPTPDEATGAQGEAPTGETEPMTTETETPEQSEATDAWLAATTGTELLGSLTRDARTSLAAAVTDWQLATVGAEGVAVTILEAPEVTPEATHVRMRVEAPGRVTWAETSISPGGTWEVREVSEGLEADPTSPIPVTDVARLSRVCGEAVAPEVSRLLIASGIEGVEGAWTCEEAVVRDGEVTRLTVWAPVEGAGARTWLVGYDATMGLLEISEATAEGSL